MRRKLLRLVLLLIKAQPLRRLLAMTTTLGRLRVCLRSRAILLRFQRQPLSTSAVCAMALSTLLRSYMCVDYEAPEEKGRAFCSRESRRARRCGFPRDYH